MSGQFGPEWGDLGADVSGEALTLFGLLLLTRARRLVIGLQTNAVDSRQCDFGSGLPRVGADLPFVRATRTEIEQELIEVGQKRLGVGRARRRQPCEQTAHAGVERLGEFGRRTNAARDVPHAVTRFSRVDVADTGEQLHRGLGFAEGGAHRTEDSGGDGRVGTGWSVAVEQLAQQRLQHANARDEIGVGRGTQIGTVAPQCDRHLLLGVDFGDRGGGHDPTEVAHDALHQVGSFVERMRFVGRNLRVIAEEGQVELLDGQEWAAHSLHTHVREVDVEVAGEEARDLGMAIGELVDRVVAAAYVAVAPTEQDAVLPAQLLAQGTGRRGQDFTCVGTCVVRPARTRVPVSDPAIGHCAPPSPRPTPRTTASN